MAFDMNKFRQAFAEEAEELFARVEELLLDAERDNDVSHAQMNELFRAIHTIKGGSASVELIMLAGFTHKVENFLDKLRNKELDYKPDMADFLLSCNDGLKKITALELSSELTQDEYNEITLPLIATLDKFLDTKHQTDNVNNGECFGFFDDEPAKPDGFGFFEDEPIKTKEAFGFFDNTPSNANDGFGFFDNTPIEPMPPIVNNLPKPQVINDTKKPAIAQINTIRVDLSKIDYLMNQIGELIISSSVLYQVADEINDKKQQAGLLEKIELIERNIRTLQESVLATRMVPMEDIYSKFPKTIRDTAKKLNKQVDFTHYGDSVEIDKAMIEGITDPLMHIIRNSIDHGIELPSERTSVGKPEIGMIRIGAEQSSGQIIISIADDGKGINYNKVALKAVEKGVITKEQCDVMSVQEKLELIFAPGLSTAEQVTDVSGRGVGMDVVKSNISKLGGLIKIGSEVGIGTTITIILPLTLAIVDGLNIRVGQTIFVLPLASMVESLQPSPEQIRPLGDGNGEILMLRDEFIPIVRLHKVFNIEPKTTDISQGMLIVVKSSSGKVAIFIDEFLNQQQVVIKPIDKNFKQISGIGGATVRGDGSIGLILDVISIVEKHKKAA